MSWTLVLRYAAGITSGISLLSFLGALYVWLQSRERERSVLETVKGQGIVHAETIVYVLKTFSSDDARLKALEHMLGYDRTRAEGVLEVVKPNVDVGKFSLAGQARLQKRLSSAGSLLVTFAFLAVGLSFAPKLPNTSVPTQPVVVPPLDIPPLVKGGAPVGTKFQFRYLKDNIQCINETVKVSATEWEQRNSSGSPVSCDVDAVIFKFTERESKDPQYFLLYDEGRNLFARIPNIPVGQTGPSDWRQLPSQAWNAFRALTRVN